MKNENLVPKVRFKGFSDPWEQRKWADLIDISTDMVDPRDVEFSELPHVGPGNIEAFSGQLLDNVNTVEKDHLISGKFHFYKGNIIYGKINPQLAKYIWADFEGLSSADTYVLTTKSANILNQGFIFYLLQTRNFYKYSVSVSMRTGMPKINRSELDAYSFLCPQSPEQIKIVQTIKILDDLIAANEDKLEQLKTLKKLMMQKIFSQKWRFKGFTDPWEQRKLGELSNGFTYGLNASAKAYDGKHQYLRITDIDDETRTFKQTHLTSPDIDFIRDNSYVLKLGDIVFTRTGASTGKTFIYRTADSIVYYAGFLIKMSVREDIDSEFVFQNTLTTSFNRFVKVMSQRSGQPGINSKEYARFKLYIPKLKEQVLVGNMLDRKSVV